MPKGMSVCKCLMNVANKAEEWPSSTPGHYWQHQDMLLGLYTVALHFNLKHMFEGIAFCTLQARCSWCHGCK